MRALAHALTNFSLLGMFRVFLKARSYGYQILKRKIVSNASKSMTAIVICLHYVL